MARQAEDYITVLAKAAREHASTLPHPHQSFMPPGGMKAFADAAFEAAKLEPVGWAYLTQNVLWKLEDRGELRRERQGSKHWLVSAPAQIELESTSSLAQLMESLRNIGDQLPQASLLELTELASALRAAQGTLKRQLEPLISDDE
jgi:hypothetical protein